MFFAVLIGAFAIGNAGPNFEKFSKARGAASALFEIIDWVKLFSQYYIVF